MRQCNFCGRWFVNKQAVRAHLKHFQEYLMTNGEKGITASVSIPSRRRKSVYAKLKKTTIDVYKYLFKK